MRRPRNGLSTKNPPTPEMVEVEGARPLKSLPISVAWSEAPPVDSFRSEGRQIAFCFGLRTPSNHKNPKIGVDDYAGPFSMCSADLDTLSRGWSVR